MTEITPALQAAAVEVQQTHAAFLAQKGGERARTAAWGKRQLALMRYQDEALAIGLLPALTPDADLLAYALETRSLPHQG